ncbi:MAG: 30S ribosomal protein S4 [Legionellales bacterium]|jgi:small subunit ribosomal protein S4|nr:30S ribosomal protein S4 [Legionellales bacterium]
MARYIGPKCKRSRSVNFNLENKSGGVAIEKKCKFGVAPGSKGQRRPRISDYGTHLKMKQTIRNYYEMLEKQFKRYYTMASGMQGSTGNNLLCLLERRLDNTVYRSGFASTRSDARQLVSHGHIQVNGQRVNVPSYFIKEGDVISIKEASRGLERIAFGIKMAELRESAEWLDVDYKNLSGIVKNFPTVDDYPSFFKVNLVVEFYSK